MKATIFHDHTWNVRQGDTVIAFGRAATGREAVRQSHEAMFQRINVRLESLGLKPTPEDDATAVGNWLARTRP